MGRGRLDQRLTAPAAAPRYLQRFAPPARVLHWAFAVSFLLLLLTGLTNFWPELKATQLGGERLFALLHVVLGFATAVALPVLVLALLTRRSLRADAREVTRVSVDDYLWLQHHGLVAFGSESQPPWVGKFNTGQKLNALVITLIALGLFGGGVILGINYLTKEVFTAGFVEDVFPWHTRLSLLAIPLIVGHLYLALLHPSTREALRGITLGVVRREWARRHHPAWAERAEAEGAPAREERRPDAR